MQTKSQTAKPQTDWDGLAEPYSKLEFQTEWKYGYSAVLSIIRPIRGKSVLDYGSGGGKFSRHLGELGASVLGVDKSPSMVTEALARDGTNVRYEKGDWRRVLGRKPSSFDAITACWVLGTIKSPRTIHGIGRAFGRVLKPGGKAVIVENEGRSFGHRFKSFYVERPVGFTLNRKTQVRVHLLGGTSDIVVLDTFWPTGELVRLLTSSTGLGFQPAKPAHGQIRRRTKEPRPFRVLVFGREEATV